MDKILITDLTLILENERGFYQFTEESRRVLAKKKEAGTFDMERAVTFIDKKIREYLKLANDPRKHYHLFGQRSAAEQFQQITSKPERMEVARAIIESWITE